MQYLQNTLIAKHSNKLYEKINIIFFSIMFGFDNTILEKSRYISSYAIRSAFHKIIFQFTFCH